jgi:ketosteroid isomerase-like protein
MTQPFDAAASRQAEQLALTFLDRVWQLPHDLDAIDELMTEDYVITSGGQTIRGRDAFKAWVKSFQELLLDARTDSQDVFASPSGDRVVSRWLCSGRNNGMLGTPADGRDICFSGVAIWTVRDGRLAECWVERSAWELYQQLTSAS